MVKVSKSSQMIAESTPGLRKLPSEVLHRILEELKPSDWNFSETEKNFLSLRLLDRRFDDLVKYIAFERRPPFSNEDSYDSLRNSFFLQRLLIEKERKWRHRGEPVKLLATIARTKDMLDEHFSNRDIRWRNTDEICKVLAELILGGYWNNKTQMIRDIWKLDPHYNYNPVPDMALHIALYLGDRNLARQMLQVGGFSTTFPVLHIAIRNPRGGKFIENLSPDTDQERQERVEIVKDLLAANPRLFGGEDIDRRTPIHLAAMMGLVEAVKMLLNNRPYRLDAYKNTAFVYAAIRGHTSTVALLLTKLPGKSQHDKACEAACENGHLQVLSLLMANYKRGISPGLLIIAARNGHKNIVEFILTKYPQGIERIMGPFYDAILSAAKGGDLSLLNFLFYWGEQKLANFDVFMPLENAVLFDWQDDQQGPFDENVPVMKHEVIRALMTIYVARYEDEHREELYGKFWDAIVLAHQRGNCSSAKLISDYIPQAMRVSMATWFLLEACEFGDMEGALAACHEDADINFGGMAPLRLAVASNSFSIVQILLRLNVNVEVDGEVKTVRPEVPWPLDFAASTPNLGMLRLLLKYGARPTSDDWRSAISSGSEEVVRLIVRAGVDVAADLPGGRGSPVQYAASDERTKHLVPVLEKLQRFSSRPSLEDGL